MGAPITLPLIGCWSVQPASRWGCSVCYVLPVEAACSSCSCPHGNCQLCTEKMLKGKKKVENKLRIDCTWSPPSGVTGASFCHSQSVQSAAFSTRSGKVTATHCVVWFKSCLTWVNVCMFNFNIICHFSIILYFYCVICLKKFLSEPTCASKKICEAFNPF